MKQIVKWIVYPALTYHGWKWNVQRGEHCNSYGIDESEAFRLLMLPPTRNVLGDRYYYKLGWGSLTCAGTPHWKWLLIWRSRLHRITTWRMICQCFHLARMYLLLKVERLNRSNEYEM